MAFSELIPVAVEVEAGQGSSSVIGSRHRRHPHHRLPLPRVLVISLQVLLVVAEAFKEVEVD